MHPSPHGIPFYSLFHCIHTRLVWISLLLLLYSVYSPAPFVHYCIYKLCFICSLLDTQSTTSSIPIYTGTRITRDLSVYILSTYFEPL